MSVFSIWRTACSPGVKRGGVSSMMAVQAPVMPVAPHVPYEVHALAQLGALQPTL